MGTGKKKIEIKQIIKQVSRMVTFSKRREGLFKKASDLESMSCARVAIVVFSPSGKVYTCGDVSSAIDAHFPQFHSSEIGSSGSRSYSSRNGLCDWLEKIEAEECGNLSELLLLKEQLEGTRDKLAEHSESFEALFM